MVRLGLTRVPRQESETGRLVQGLPPWLVVVRIGEVAADRERLAKGFVRADRVGEVAVVVELGLQGEPRIRSTRTPAALEQLRAPNKPDSVTVLEKKGHPFVGAGRRGVQRDSTRRGCSIPARGSPRQPVTGDKGSVRTSSGAGAVPR
jgi:hypothetical protein